MPLMRKSMQNHNWSRLNGVWHLQSWGGDIARCGANLRGSKQADRDQILYHEEEKRYCRTCLSRLENRRR